MPALAAPAAPRAAAGGGGGGRGGGRKAPQQSAIEQHYLAELRKFIEEKGMPRECKSTSFLPFGVQMPPFWSGHRAK
jgi:hypothetical protein